MPDKARSAMTRTIERLMLQHQPPLNRTDLAQRMGMQPQSIYNLLSRGIYTLVKLERLAKALDLSLPDLLEESRLEAGPGQVDPTATVVVPLAAPQDLATLGGAGSYRAATRHLPRMAVRRCRLTDYDVARSAVIVVEGRSMEPQLAPGDQVLCVRVAPADFDQITGPVLALTGDGRVLWRRVVANALPDGALVLRADRDKVETVVPGAEVSSLWRPLRLVERELY